MNFYQQEMKEDGFAYPEAELLVHLEAKGVAANKVLTVSTSKFAVQSNGQHCVHLV